MKILILFCCFLIAVSSCTKIVNSVVTNEDTKHVSFELLVKIEEDNAIIDLAPIHTQEYRPTACGITSRFIYASLQQNGFQMCMNGTSYSDFVHDKWKMLSCNSSEGNITAYMSFKTSLSQLHQCAIDSYSVPMFERTDSVYGMQIVQAYYYDDYDYQSTFEVEFHYDLQPNFAYVLGTNYAISGPVYHNNMPYGKVTAWSSKVSNYLNQIFGYISTTDIGLAFESYMAFIPTSNSRTYAGTMYILCPIRGFTDIDNPLGKLNVQLTLTTDTNHGVTPTLFEIENGNFSLSLLESNFISPCIGFPKVVFSNGQWSLSSTNYDLCAKYQLQMYGKKQRNYTISYSSEFMIVSNDGVVIDYATNLFGLRIEITDSNVVMKSELTISLFQSLTYGNRSLHICSISKSTVLPDMTFSWTTKQYTNESDLVLLTYEISNRYSAYEIMSYINDAYVLNICTPSNYSVVIRPFKDMSYDMFSLSEDALKISKATSSTDITLVFSFIIIPFMIAIVTASYFYSRFYATKYSYHHHQ